MKKYKLRALSMSYRKKINVIDDRIQNIVSGKKSETLSRTFSQPAGNGPKVSPPPDDAAEVTTPPLQVDSARRFWKQSLYLACG